MSKLDLKPWELGDEIQTTGIPPLCVGDFVLVKLATPKGKTTRDGLVGTFLMTAYYDTLDNKVELINAKESADGYKIEFPLGKRGLVATKFRGPRNYYRFLNPETNKFYQIPQSAFTPEYANEYLAQNISDWNVITAEEKEELIDEYLSDMFLYGLSQDLALPITDDNYIVPAIGLKTKLYRVYTPPAEGEKYGNTIITKWHKGYSSLTGEYEIIPETVAIAMYEEYTRRDENTSFDPENFVESDVV